MRKLLILFLMVVALQVGAAQKPNVIFVLCDDLGYADVGFAGATTIKTPNLDRLAREGVVLSDHYCAAPVCAPSRGSILTGVRQDRCSVHDNMFDWPITEPETLGTVMKKGGYRTMAIGKWGVGGGGESHQPVTAHPLDKGFDSYFGFMDHMAGHTYYHYAGYIRGAYMGLWEGKEQGASVDGYEGVYSTDLFLARAKHEIGKTVKEHPGEPFFLYLAVNTIHGSGQSGDNLIEKHTLHVPGRPFPKNGLVWPLRPEPLAQRNTWIDPRYKGLKNAYAQRYATAISRLDDALGDLMKYLEKSGLAKNTIIIFTSDNGPADEYGADPRFFGSTGPFDGFKRDVYEGGLRVPTFVWRRGGFGVHVDREPSISTDWMATLAAIAGVKAPAQCEGVNLLPRWSNGGEGARSKEQGASVEVVPSTIKTRYNGGAGYTEAYREFAARKKGLVRGQQEMRREGDIVTLRAGGPGAPERRYNVKDDPHEDRDLNACLTPPDCVGSVGTQRDGK